MRLRPVSKAKIAAAAARFRWPGWRAERLEDRTLFSSPSDVEWLQQFGSLSPSATSGRAVDADGNVFLAGRVRGALLGQTDAGGLDAFVSKFDAAGNALWTRQFGTPFDDEVNGVAVDGTGVYVSGSVPVALPGQANAGNGDAFLRKYDLDGNELWTRQFGTAGIDVGGGVAADGAGVYLTGSVSGALPGQTYGGGRDSFVRRYDADGNELWTRQYSITFLSEATDVAVVGTEIYVAGHTGVSVVIEDAYVRKYDAVGNAVWTRQFGSRQPDAPLDIAADALGVYVVGFTQGVLPGQPGIEFGVDSFIRKYDAAGNEQWTHQFDCITHQADNATGVAVDASGVYVSGFTSSALPGQTSAGGTDAYLRKYDAGGSELWTREFGSTGGDLAFGVAADVSGIYVVGTTDGAFPGQTGTGGGDLFVRKYDAAGAEIWTRQVGTGLPGASDIARAAAADGNVYLVGEVTGFLPGQTVNRSSESPPDVFVRKYDAGGNELWTRQFGTNRADSAAAVAVDGSGIYVAGYTAGTLAGQSSAGGRDAFIRRYDAAGNEVWTRQFGTNGPDEVTGIAVGAFGVYVTGSTSGVFPGQFSGQVFVRKYDVDGNDLWTRQFGNSGLPTATGIAADASSVYVSGFTSGNFQGQASAGGQDAFVRAYNPFGSESWTRQFGTAGTDQATGIAAGPSGVYVGGLTTGTFAGQTSAGGQDAFVRAFDRFGQQRWTRQFGTAATDQANGVATNVADVYVAGTTAGALPGETSSGGQDAFVLKYDAEGAAMWTGQFGTTAADSAAAVAVSPAGVFVAGSTTGAFPGKASAGGQDVFVAKVADNQAPLANPDQGYSVDEDNTLIVAAAGVLANDVDPEGDALSAVLVTGPTHGTLTLNADGSFAYTPSANSFITDVFTYRASDGLNKSNTATVIIRVNAVNDAPVAHDDAYAVDEDTTLTVPVPGVLGNDTDVDLDPEFEALLATLVSGPSHGMLTFGFFGSFTYAPDANYHGPDSFTYKASDAFTDSAPAVAVITVTPDDDEEPAPNTAPSSLVLTPGSPVTENGTATLSGSFTDPDAADAHSLVIDWGDGEQPTTLNLVAGVLTFSTGHLYRDDNPTGTTSDVYAITVNVSDAAAAASGGASLTINNVAPVATITGPAAGSEYVVGAPIPLIGAFTDIGTADIHTAQWTIDGATFAGSVTQGAGSGTVSDSYPFTAPGVYPVTLTIVDDDGGVGREVVLVTIVRQPTATSVSSSASPSAFGEPVIFTATVSGAGGAGVPTGTVQFRVDGADFGDPVPLLNGAASIGAAGLSAEPHAITAVYSGDGFFASSTSGALSQVVNEAATATSASVSAATPLLGVDALRIQAVISVVAPGGGSPTGSVTFYDGATLLGTAGLVDGAASFTLADSALAAGAHTLRAVYSGDANFLGSESTAAVTVFAPSAIQGLVYVDADDDGQVDFGERAIAGVTVTLTGTDDLGHAVNRIVQTDANGIFAIANLRPSNGAGYSVTETQPAGLLDGRDTLGTVNGILAGNAAVNDVFSGIVLSQGASIAENYNFGERTANDGGVAAGQTATIGYWQNRNGQNLLLALNGGPTATRLGHWLASTFPNLYASLDGQTNAQVASFYKTLFARTSKTAPPGPTKVDCQVLATAFAVYVTNQTLAGTTAVPYGFQVSATGVGTHTFNVGTNGAAFGVANESSISVMTLLLAANSRSRNGLLYDQNGDGRISSSEAGLRTMANDVFSGINETGDI